MIKKLIYLCPKCGVEDSIDQIEDFLCCSSCQSRFPFQNNIITFNNQTYQLSIFYDFIKNNLPLRTLPDGPVFRESGQAVLRQGLNRVIFIGSEKESTLIESPVEVDEGVLRFEQDKLVFKGTNSDWIFNSKEFISFSTNSKYLEFKVEDKPFFQIFFKDESPLKYEELLLKWYSLSLPSLKFLEHQPRIITKIPSVPRVFLSRDKVDRDKIKDRSSFFQLMLHICIALPITGFMKWYSYLQFRNKDLIPGRGPCIIIANHQSYLDPILLSTLSPRRIGWFTKSTSFAHRFLQPIFRAYNSLPTRRYETDPIVIRQAIRRLLIGQCIGIFPEGERTWDGRLGGFKYSTVRFLLSMAVPIVVVKIEGGYQVLPRWSRRIAKGKIDIVVQRCFSLLPGEWDVPDLKAELESYFQS